MARKQQNTIAEDLVGLTAMLPWWAGVGLAAASYALIHPFAAPVTIVEGATTNEAIGAQLVRILAQYGQYGVPILFLIGAAVSLFRYVTQRMKRPKKPASPAEQTAAAPPSRSDHGSEPNQGLTWRQFEVMVGQVFQRQGYEVTETESGADGGVDLELRTGGQLYLVQCKHWKKDVGVKIARELAGVVAMRGATGGFLVTSGRFTEPTKQEFGQADSLNKVFLVDGRTLKAMAADVASRPDLAPPPAPTQPACPRCNSVMVERRARKGNNAGSLFWGCSTYPKCRGTRQMEEAASASSIQRVG